MGKTYVVRQFASQYFDNLLEINFEKEAKFSTCFQSLDPVDINNAISLIKGQDITPGKTLLFLDEIQACPKAIMALRYFKEELPELHVIGAGSLLEFAINNEGISMPVGRVQYIYLKPLSFVEFLQASKRQKLVDYLTEVTLKTHIPQAVHEELLKLVRQYMALGGMPMVVASYLEKQDLRTCQRYQTLLLSTYRDDFGKYANKTQLKYLEKVYDKVPGLVGQTIKYKTIDPDMRSRDLKIAIANLNHAGVMNPVFASTASGLPLVSFVNEKKFKLLLLDIGLLKRATGLVAGLLMNEDIMLLNQGALVEQFVGQEIQAYQDCYEKPVIYYWSRENKRSEAEVDYITHIDANIIPIEVKSGKTGSLKSLHLFMEEKHSKIGIRVSPNPLQLEGNILSVPFYLLGQWERLAREAFNTEKVALHR